MFDLTVSETGESGSTDVSLENAPLPYTVHIFGKDAVARWSQGQDEQRINTVMGIIDRIAFLVANMGLAMDEAATAYNMVCAKEGILDHAVEFTG